MSVDQSNEAPVPSEHRDPPAFLRNIAAGFRLALFMPVQRADFRADVNQAVYALSALVIFSALLDFVDALPFPEFNSYGIGYLAATNLVGLLALWLVAAIRRSSPMLAQLVVMTSTAFVTSGVVIYAIYFLLEQGPEGMTLWIAHWALFLAAILWQLAIAIRAFGKALDLSLRRSFAFSLLYLLVALAPILGLPNQSVWYEGMPAEDVAEVAPDYRPIDVEKTFYAQPGMVDRALSGIAPGRPGIADLYFVGFAGYGAQDVFMKEVKVANSLFDRQFDTEGRSLSLVNNHQTIEDLPLANASNLRLALDGLAERMDRDEDVLFLFLTSHGSKDRLATRFWPLQHNDLAAADLRSILDAAGIGWRVIVISACYSGSYSFGCSNEADMTYFGRALIDEALRETRSFTTAYDLARERVTMREEAEGKTPSEPQISVGSEIQAKLAELTERLEALSEVAADN
jgi:hypothetical protein